MTRIRWNTLIGRGPADLVHCNRVFYPPEFAFPLHDHDFHELAFIVSGHGFHDHDGGSDALEPGVLIAIRPGLRHRCRAAGQALTFINLVFAPRFLAARPEALAAVPGWEGGGPPPLLRPAGDDLQALLGHLAEIESGATADPLSAAVLLADLAWRCRRQRSRQRLRLPEAIARLQEACGDPALLAGGATAIAAHLGLSREHLTRLAGRHLGKPLSAFIVERRLDHAARLLRHGNAEVTAICHASGHGNLGHFHAVFKRRFGCTPQAYRQQAASGPA